MKDHAFLMSKNKKNLAVTIYSSNRIICNPLFCMLFLGLLLYFCIF